MLADLKIYNPAILQWNGRQKHYFEGWYFKCISADKENAIAVIPGISIEKNKSHAFIQFFDARNKKSFYFTNDMNEFSASKRIFEVKIGKNFFCDRFIELDIDQNGVNIYGRLEFGDFIPWPVKLLSPGAMGWYAFVPKMECYHGNLGFDHSVDGSLLVDGKEYYFNGGRGYCEKDWGTSMPSSWIWMQTNHFDRAGISLFASIADIPWLGGSFTGYLLGFLYDDHIHRFTTYTGAKLTGLQVDDKHISFTMHDGENKIEISGERADGVTLAAPSFGEMSTKIQESLASVIHVRFYKRNNLIFEGSGTNAGLEYVGEIEKLIAGIK